MNASGMGMKRKNGGSGCFHSGYFIIDTGFLQCRFPICRAIKNRAGEPTRFGVQKRIWD
jgi:hypothetical protein